MISMVLNKISIKASLIAILLSSYILLVPFKRLYWICAIGLLVLSVLNLFFKYSFFEKDENKEYVWKLFNIPVIFSFLISVFVVDYKQEPIELFCIYFILFILGITIIRLLNNDKVWLYLQNILGFYIIFIAVDGFFQGVYGFDLFGVEKKSRLGGFFSDDLKFGFYIAALSGWAIFLPCLRSKFFLIQLGVILTLATVVFFGNTRAALISFAYLILIFFYIERKRVGYKTIVVVPIALAALFSVVVVFDGGMLGRFLTLVPESFSLESIGNIDPIRWGMWNYSYDLIKDNFFFGVGPGNFQIFVPAELKGTSLDQPYAHQVIFDFMVGFGLVGCILILSSFLFLFLCIDYKRAKEMGLNALPLAPIFMLISFWFPLNSHRDPFGSEMLLMTWLTFAITFSRLPIKRIKSVS